MKKIFCHGFGTSPSHRCPEMPEFTDGVQLLCKQHAEEKKKRIERMNEKTIFELIEDEECFEAPETKTFVSKHYEFLFSIGNDFTASLIIDEEALNELKKRNKG